MIVITINQTEVNNLLFTSPQIIILLFVPYFHEVVVYFKVE